jgi:hypothetical protein
VLVTPTAITFATSISTIATTYTVAGIKVLTGSDTGPVDVDVKAGACGDVQPAPTTTTTSTSTTTTTSTSTTTTSTSTTTTMPTTATTQASCGNILECLLGGLLGGLGGASTGPATAASLSPAAVSTAALPVGTPYIRGVRIGTVGLVLRIAGANRYATAAAIAVTSDGGAAPDLSGKTVVIARGDNFPDALAASYLAGQNDVPILLTRPNAVPPETLAALKATGATKVVLVGGLQAINQSVEDTLSATHTFEFGSGDQQDAVLDVTRVGGVDRYHTAALVAEAPGLDQGGTLGIRTNDGCTTQKFAIVASGENFPDALAAGGLAYHGANATDGDGCGEGPIPLLLTQKDGLTPATVQGLSDLGVEHVLVIGGPAAVSAATFNAIDALPGINATRVAGATRQETAVALAQTVLGPETIGNWDSGKALAVRPDTFPDALAASSISGSQLAPIYLTESGTTLGDVVTQSIMDYPVPTYIGALIGGTDALSNDVLVDLARVIASQPG